jgi:hypothetical protein
LFAPNNFSSISFTYSFRYNVSDRNVYSYTFFYNIRLSKLLFSSNNLRLYKSFSSITRFNLLSIYYPTIDFILFTFVYFFIF